MIDCDLLSRMKGKQSKKLLNTLQMEVMSTQTSKKKQLSELQNFIEILETESNLIKNLEVKLFFLNF